MFKDPPLRVRSLFSFLPLWITEDKEVRTPGSPGHLQIHAPCTSITQELSLGQTSASTSPGERARRMCSASDGAMCISVSMAFRRLSTCACLDWTSSCRIKSSFCSSSKPNSLWGNKTQLKNHHISRHWPGKPIHGSSVTLEFFVSSSEAPKYFQGWGVGC